jgi:hypothetical protein
MPVVVREAKALDVAEAGTIQADAPPRDAAPNVVEDPAPHRSAGSHRPSIEYRVSNRGRRSYTRSVTTSRPGIVSEPAIPGQKADVSAARSSLLSP